jgi:hypothetical protein
MRHLLPCLPRPLHHVNPARTHEGERFSAMRYRLACQPAAHPEAISDRHSRPGRWKHDRDFAGLVDIEHQDYADGRATHVRINLADIADDDDFVMMPWCTHVVPSPQLFSQPLILRLLGGILQGSTTCRHIPSMIKCSRALGGSPASRVRPSLRQMKFAAERRQECTCSTGYCEFIGVLPALTMCWVSLRRVVSYHVVPWLFSHKLDDSLQMEAWQ